MPVTHIADVEDVWTAIPQSTTPRDVGVLFTGLPCTSSGGLTSFGSSNGEGTLCQNVAVASITSCSFVAGAPQVTLAHEIGHTMNAGHPNGNGTAACTAMPCNLGAGANSLMCNGSCPLGLSLIHI